MSEPSEEKKKKKTAKELLAEEEEKKRKDKEKEDKEREDEALDPLTVRGRMNLIYLMHVQRRREMFMARMEMKTLDNMLGTIRMSGEAMADYLLLSQYAMKADGTMSQKRLDGPVPEGLLDPKNPEKQAVQNWLLKDPGSDKFMEHMDDMAELPPEGFVKKKAGEFADHMKKEKQARDPEAVGVAPRGFHAPGVMPFMAAEPEEPVLKPADDWKDGH